MLKQKNHKLHFASFCILLIGCSSIVYKHKNLNGKYEKEFVSSYFCQEKEFEEHYLKNKNLYENYEDQKGMCLYLAQDKMEIKNFSKDKFEINLDLTFFNGHKCYLENAKFVWNKDKYKFEENYFDSGKNEDVCILTLEVIEDVVSIKASSHKACGVYCGARGTLDGMKFPLNTKLKKRKK